MSKHEFHNPIFTRGVVVTCFIFFFSPCHFSKVKVTSAKVTNSKSDQFPRSSGDVKSDSVVHCRSTPSLELSLLLSLLLPRIRLLFEYSTETRHDSLIIDLTSKSNNMFKKNWDTALSVSN